MIYFSLTENLKSKILNLKLQWHTINLISLRVAQCRYQ